MKHCLFLLITMIALTACAKEDVTATLRGICESSSDCYCNDINCNFDRP